MVGSYVPLDYPKCREKIVMLADDIHARRDAYYREPFEVLIKKVNQLMADYIKQCEATNSNSWWPLKKSATDTRKSQINFIHKVSESVQRSMLASDAQAKSLAEMRARDVLLGAILYRYMRLKNETALITNDLLVVIKSLLNLNAPGVKPLDDFTLLSCYQAFYDYLYTPVSEGAIPIWEQFEYIKQDTDFKRNLEGMMGVETDKNSLRSKCIALNHQMTIVAILQQMVIQLSEDEAFVMKSYEAFKQAIKRSDYSFTAVSTLLNDSPKKYSPRFRAIILAAWPLDEDELGIANLRENMDVNFKPNLTTIFQYPLLAMCFLIKEKLPMTEEYEAMRIELSAILKQTKTNVIGPEDLNAMMLALQNYMDWPDGALLNVSALWPEDRLFKKDIEAHIQEDEVNTEAFQLS